MKWRNKQANQKFIIIESDQSNFFVTSSYLPHYNWEFVPKSNLYSLNFVSTLGNYFFFIINVTRPGATGITAGLFVEWRSVIYYILLEILIWRICRLRGMPSSHTNRLPYKSCWFLTIRRVEWPLLYISDFDLTF